MPDRFVEAFVEKLILLEGVKSAPASAHLLDPFNTQFQDVLSMQAAAKELAKFIGLDGFTFLVAIAKQKINTGGHIDLSTRGKEVFIEIDKDVVKFPEPIWATLCHELCHKWLQVHSLPSAHIEIENEILTDIATVYLGMGKIMLNGCESERQWNETVSGGTRTHKEAISVGYLKRDQLAFVYRLTCSMRNIPKSDQLRGLNHKARQAIQACDQSFGYHYDDKFHDTRTVDGFVHDFYDRLITTQHNFAELNKHAAYIRASFCDTSENFFISGHRRIEALRQKASDTPISGETTSTLRFLKGIQKKHVIDRLSVDMHTLQQELSEALGTAQQISFSLSRNSTRFPQPPPDIFRIVICPKDGAKLRLPEGTGHVVVRCPTCKYEFAYNRDALMFTAPKAPRKMTWKEKLFGLFH
jgi:hypothetical protein